MEKQNNIPELRFPEFAEAWQSKKMGLFAKFSKGKGISKSDISEDGETECIRYGELYTIYNEVIDKVYSKTNVNKRDLVLSEANDVIIPGSGETQIDIATASCVLKSGVALGGDLNIIKSENNGVFLSYNLNNRKKIEIAKIAQGNSVVHLYSSQLASLNINLPSIPEQQKVASFLTAVDNKLTQLKQKKTILDQYKKGIMQKIFSQEIRFKEEDGKEFPEWEKKKLGELYSFISTNSFSRENLNYENGEVKNIHYGDIHTKFKVQFDITKELVPYINSEIQLRITENNYCREGDLVIADASEDYADVGKSIEIMNLNHEKTVAGLHTILARPDLSILAIGFGGFLMKSHAVRNQIMIIAQGTKVLSISTGRLAVIKIGLPIKAEQTKIANFLSAIDEKINHCQLQIEKTVLYKKGLLQKMFC